MVSILERKQELRLYSLFWNLTNSNPGLKAVSSNASPGWTVTFLGVMIRASWKWESRPIKWHECRHLTRQFLSVLTNMIYVRVCMSFLAFFFFLELLLLCSLRIDQKRVDQPTRRMENKFKVSFFCSWRQATCWTYFTSNIHSILAWYVFSMFFFFFNANQLVRRIGLFKFETTTKFVILVCRQARLKILLCFLLMVFPNAHCTPATQKTRPRVRQLMTPRLCAR
jgi:hypothetical protein